MAYGSTMKWFTFLLIVGLITEALAAGQKCIQGDVTALLAFKKDLRCKAIPGSSACPLDSWDVGINCCTWNGVTCDVLHRVIGVSLTGALKPPSTFQISRSANSNSFGKSLASLTELQILELSTLGLDTYLPPAWGSISKLKNLVIKACRIYGDIPVEYGKLRNLEVFQIENDEPPAARSSGKFGIRKELCTLKKLREFSLRGFSLSGGIPDCINEWTSIETFDVSNGAGNDDGNGRYLNGRRPYTIGLTGALPGSFGKLKTLKRLDLNSNRLSGSIPKSLGDLTNLEFLNLGMNRFTDQVPWELSNLKKVLQLYLNGNQLSGNLPSSLGKLKGLVELDLGSNQFSGRIPEPVLNLFDLEVLRLDDNKFEGPLPRGDLPGRRSQFGLRLNLSRNSISGQLDPPKLPPNTQELYMCCQNGRMARTGIPSSISVLTKLMTLDLHENRLEGEIPKSLGDLPDIYQVDLSYNNLMGKVPRNLKALGSRLKVQGNPLLQV